LSVCSIAFQPAQAGEFKTASDQAVKNYETKVGRQYRDLFSNSIDRAVVTAMGACAKANAVERAELIFIVSADGRIVRVLPTPGIAYGQCIVSKRRRPKTVPRPPQDSWPVVIGVAWNERRAGPPDTPRRVRGEEQVNEFDKAIAPYIAKARATYPTAKKRFLEGLPPGYSFSVWTRLFQKDAKTRELRHEDVFVDVDSIKDGAVHGRINNRIDLLTNHKKGERISVRESDVRNWLILRPDGVEEGNAVGKFLDHYKPQ
jgi:uncharacterized protein YegJ (DUF2314 family)